MNLHRNVQSSFELRDETWSKQVETDKVCNWALAKTREMSNTNAAMDLLQHTFQLESLHSYEWETRRMSQEVLKKNNINDRRVIKNAICQLEIFMFHVAGCPQGTEMIACHSGLILAQDIWNQRFHLTRLMMRHPVYWVARGGISARSITILPHTDRRFMTDCPPAFCQVHFASWHLYSHVKKGTVQSLVNEHNHQ